MHCIKVPPIIAKFRKVMHLEYIRNYNDIISF